MIVANVLALATATLTNNPNIKLGAVMLPTFAGWMLVIVRLQI